MASITQPFVRVIRAGLRRYRQRNEIREEKEKQKLGLNSSMVVVPHKIVERNSSRG